LSSSSATPRLKLISFFNGKLRFYQPEAHKLSVDLVLFVSRLKGIRRSSRVLDLGAGFGFLTVTVAKKWGCSLTALELDGLMLELLKKNLKLNRVEAEVIEGDLRRVETLIKRGSFDAVVTNPPFYPAGYAPKPDPYHFELTATLKDFVRAASYALRDGGYLNLLIPAFRLAETFELLKEYNLSPCFLTAVYPTVKKGARLYFVAARRNVRCGLQHEPPIIINREDGSYEDEVEALLRGLI